MAFLAHCPLKGQQDLKQHKTNDHIAPKMCISPWTEFWWIQRWICSWTPHHHYPLSINKPIAHNSDGYRVDPSQLLLLPCTQFRWILIYSSPLNYHYPLKHQQAYSTLFRLRGHRPPLTITRWRWSGANSTNTIPLNTIQMDIETETDVN